jgi:uroporphyrinogen III methyltransferase/synthase
VAELPLAGRRIVVTRPREQAEPLAAALERLGADVAVVPLISIDPVADVEQLKASMHGLHRYDWLVVTSANGVAALAPWVGLEWLARTAQVAAVGPVTAAALRRLGVEPAFVPERFAAEEIAAGLGQVEGVRILLVQGELADPGLAQDLREQGAVVDEIHTYRTVPADAAEAELAELGAADAVVLMSGSAVRSIAAQGGPGDALVVCIGPKTAEVAREVGLRVGLVADEATSQGIIRALVEHYGESM